MDILEYGGDVQVLAPSRCGGGIDQLRSAARHYDTTAGRKAMTMYPVPVFLVSLTALSIAAWIGRRASADARRSETMREEFGIIQGATLTLLGRSSGSRSRWR